MNKNDFSILIGGAAGQGSRKAGLLIAKIFNTLGYGIFIYDDYQSLIKGGHSFSLIRISDKEPLSHSRSIDFLLALDERTIEEHEKDLNKEGAIVFNKDRIKNSKGTGIAIETIVKESGGIPIMANTALIAGFAKIMGIEWEVLEEALKKEIEREIDKNLEIAKKAFDGNQSIIEVKRLNNAPRPLLTGNEAVALGGVKAGLEIYYAYPMTPATGILHYLAEHSHDLNVCVSQLENEIAVINAAIGSAHAGKRSMVGTSGGGFALMTEALSMAVQAETPLVIVESQRPGPASGVPTYQAQGDLLFSLFAGHGDIVKFVIAPGDANEAFYWTARAMNLAWKYQTPVIVLIDKELSESTYNFNEEEIKKEEGKMWDGKGEYKRYLDLKDGISPMAFPGGKGIVKATSYEHDESGITTEEAEAIKKMQEKRMRKFELMREEAEKMPSVNVFGNLQSKTAVVCFGSVKGAVREAAEEAGLKMVQPLILEPFPQEQMKKALKGSEKIICVENNASGQLAKLLSCFGIKVDEKVLKYDGRPFFKEELKKII